MIGNHLPSSETDAAKKAELAFAVSDDRALKNMRDFG